MNRSVAEPKIPKVGAKTESIRVAEKIIADISSGIYRTPGAALKELVANAYDAEATEVRIETGAPDFDRLVIRDNGNGMNAERFLQVMRHIGGSWKRIDNPEGVTPRLKRPVIGRIGIGLLAVAQLGQRFYVSSTERGSTSRFLAEVDLSSFHKDDAALRSMGAVTDKNDEVEIGVIKYVDNLPERKNSHFTVITVLNPKQGIVSELHGQLRAAVGADAEYTIKEPAKNFRKLTDAVLKSKRADTVLDSYHYLLWELGLLAPVSYSGGKIFDSAKRTVEGADKLVVSTVADFSVKVDGYDITRPIQFPNSASVGYGGPDPIVYPLLYDRKVAGRRLHFTGYVYSQQPRIDPVELQGVQIRIRNVGIGGFDKTWMGYPFDEGIKFGQVCGEIWIHEGLESALNIDRASFRETDPHYLALRASIWSELRKRIFPDFKSRQEKFRKQRKEDEKSEVELRLSKALSNAPEIVGVRPKAKAKTFSAPISKTEMSPSNKSFRKRETDHQLIVTVEDGEAVIDQEILEKIGDVRGVQRDRLLRVCAVLAAYGVWDRLKHDEAEELLRALAIAVEQ